MFEGYESDGGTHQRWNSLRIEWSEGAPVMVLIHGLGLNRHTWRWHEPALAARYRVLCYDLYAHGDSAPPPVKPSLSVFRRNCVTCWTRLHRQRRGHRFFTGRHDQSPLRYGLSHRVRALAILNSPHERSPEAQKLVEERAAQTAKAARQQLSRHHRTLVHARVSSCMP